MASNSANKKVATVTVTERKGSGDGDGNSSNDSSSITPSLKSPSRTARFAEATSVNSPIERTAASRAPWENNDEGTTTHYKPQPQPGDVGFGYINDRRSQAEVQHVEMPSTPGGPLKSALKSPGAMSRFETGLKSPMFVGIDEEALKSPTWREEKLLEKREERTDKIQRKDLKVKIRVRIAKFLLRITNFSCSLIVLAMLASTVTIFQSTKDLPPRNGLPPWAPETPAWPQITVLVFACLSLFASVIVMGAMCWGGKRLRSKWQTYYQIISVGFFSFSIVMWAIGAGILHHAKATGDGKDMWGWSCKQNTRQVIFNNSVDYQLLCRLQNWSLVCCLIEVVVETITILVYGIIFYRFWSKRRLRNTMAARDKARSELYQSQIRSGANTPYAATFASGALSPPLPYSPREGGYNPMYSPRFGPGSSEGAGSSTPAPKPATDGKFASLAAALTPAPAPTTAPSATGTTAAPSQSKKPFVLQAPPTKKTAGANSAQSPQSATSPAFSFATTPNTAYSFETAQQNSRPTTPRIQPLAANPTAASTNTTAAPAAPGERTYDAVPIPGAYGIAR